MVITPLTSRSRPATRASTSSFRPPPGAGDGPPYGRPDIGGPDIDGPDIGGPDMGAVGYWAGYGGAEAGAG
ncbi:hypothetical protein GCM10027605_21300 [Micromonospora zhanjiangensis]